MSAKLLNASGWDDVNNFGEITRSTLQQRFITNRILERSLFNNHESHADVTISALQSMLAFEVRLPCLWIDSVLIFDIEAALWQF